MEIGQADIVLCKFYFSDFKKFKNRPVLVFKDNLPYNDFVAIPISSKIENLKDDEMLMSNNDFYEGRLPVNSKMMIRKTFIVSKESIVKRYGKLTESAYLKYHMNFCKYFGCK
jgi:mRNA interferase MazF